MITEASCRETHVNRVLQSAEFFRSERMGQLLRFLVAKAEAGELSELRERPIGIAVFGRASDWDPKIDTIVRSEVRRLRAKLDRYYEGPGKNEPLRLWIPKGSYVAEWSRPATPLQPTEPEPLVVVAPASRRRGLWRYWATGSAMAIVCLFAWPLRWHSSGLFASGKSPDFVVVPFAMEAGQQFSPAISPDGKRIAFVWDGGASNFDVYVKDVDSGALRRVTEAASADIHPAWSPDGERLAYLEWTSSSLKVMVADLAAGRSQQVATIGSLGEGWASENVFAGCRSPTWTPDGAALVVTEGAGEPHDHGLVSIDLRSGARQTITTPAGGDEDCCPRFSPDGQTIAFVRYISHGQSDIYSLSKKSGQLQRITRDSRNIRGLSWSRDGERIIYASNRQGSYEIRSMSRQGGASESLPSNTASASEPAMSPDGKWLAFVESTENWNIWRADLDGSGRLGAPRRLIASSGKNHSPSFSPDGMMVAFVSDRSGSPEIWLTNPEGQQPRQVTHFNGPWLGTIRWSPDSRAMVFDARPKGHSAIFTMPASGGVPTLVKDGDFEVRRPAWSKDGKSIYFDIHQNGKPRIHKMNLANGIMGPVAPLDSLVPTESFDGQQLFFTSSNRDLWMSRSDGRQAEVIRDIHPEPELDWAVARDGIYFASAAVAGTTLNMYRFSDRKVFPIGQVPQSMAPGTPSLVVSSDGRSLLYVTVDYTKSDIKLRRIL